MFSLLPEFVVTQNAYDTQFDSVLLLGEPAHCNGSFKDEVDSYNKLDRSTDVKIIACSGVPGSRIIYSPTGGVDGDFDDVRNFQDAAIKGTKRALLAGCKMPLIILPSSETYKYATEVSLLGVLHALYTPLEVREFKQGAPYKKVQQVGLWSQNEDSITHLIKIVSSIEMGRIIACDIGGSDPERMAPPNVAKYLQCMFNTTVIKMETVSDKEIFKKDYPLLAAVDRWSGNISSQAGQLIKLEYTGEGPIDQTLMLVGKGITYDTGGADIKTGGFMQGMHRDKCGAAAVAGFFQTLATYKPKGLKVIGALPMVKNGFGPECYVADEIITSRAGVRVRVGNTDAEGRMVMADVLCEMKEKAVKEVNPCLFTVATLTGHAIRCYGEGYASILDNGPAAREQMSQKLASAGEESGDPIDITRLRREDFVYVSPETEYEDVLQCKGRLPSTMTNRGHQYPAAFLIKASGLDKHGCNSAHPLRYSHIDMAGSSGPFPGIPTGSPVVALTHAFVLHRESSA